MDKLKAVVVGAFPRFVQKIEKRLNPILDFRLISTDGDRLTSDLCTGARVIIVLTDYVSRRNIESARVVGRSRQIPVVECKSENYVQNELTRLKILKADSCSGNGNGKPEPPKSEPKPEAKPVAAVPETVVGIDQHDLWKLYGDRMKEVVEVILEPGKHYHERDVLSFMAREVGLPEADIKPLLEELGARGLIVRTAAQTWKRPSDKEDETILEDKTEVKAKEPFRRDDIVKKIRGLAPGPYPSRWACAMHLREYKDFLKKDGTIPTKSYCGIMLKWAEDAGFVEERGGKIFVLNDPSVKLETNPDYVKPVDRRKVKKTRVKEEPASKPASVISGVPTKYVSLADIGTAKPAAKPMSKERPTDEKGRRAALGPIPSPSDVLSGQLKTLKGLMQTAFWDEAAFREMESRFVKLGFPQKTVVPKILFAETEWDALAWADVSKLPMRVVVPTWKAESYEDEKLTCIDCHETFIFTKGEKDYFFRTFGEVRSPKRCKWCKKIHKERGGDDSADQDRILRRHGE